jgi:hypothetical protein
MNENLIGQQIPVSIISAYIIQWLKIQPWFPFAKLNAVWTNRIMSGFIALVTAGLIHYTYGANGDFTITGNVWTLLHGLWAAIQQYALQHVVYKVAIAPPASPVLVAAEPPHEVVTQDAPAKSSVKI